MTVLKFESKQNTFFFRPTCVAGKPKFTKGPKVLSALPSKTVRTKDLPKVIFIINHSRTILEEFDVVHAVK
jgi:hypothetical protein